MCMDAHGRRSYIGSDSKVGQPQVFYEGVAKAAADCLIEVASAKHRRHRVCQVEYLAPPLRHFLKTPKNTQLKNVPNKTAFRFSTKTSVIE